MMLRFHGLKRRFFTTVKSSPVPFNSYIESAPLNLNEVTAKEAPSLLFYFTKYPEKLPASYTLLDTFKRIYPSGSNFDNIDKIEDSIMLSDEQLGMILYSFKALSKVNPRDYNNFVIGRIASMVEQRKDQHWSNKTLRMAIYGLQNMNRYGEFEKVLLRNYTAKLIALNTAKLAAEKGGKSKLPALFLSPREIASTLYGLRNLSSDHREVRELVQAVSLHMPATINESRSVEGVKQRPIPQVKARDISNAVFGIQKLSPLYAEVRTLLVKLIPLVNAYTNRSMSCSSSGDSSGTISGSSTGKQNSKDSTRIITEIQPQDFDNVLFGLRSMSSFSYFSKQLIKSLIPFITQYSASLDMADGVRPSIILKPYNISAALHGLQNLHSKHEVVRELLFAVNEVLRKTSVILQAEAVRESGSIETPKRLSWPITKKYVMSGMAVGNALYGLRNFTSNSPEVRDTLRLLLPYIARVDDDSMFQNMNLSSPANSSRSPDQKVSIFPEFVHFSEPHNISNCFYGLRRMSSNWQETRDIVRALIPLIGTCKGKMNAKEVSNTLYGLQSMSSDHFEVKCLIRALTPVVSKCEDTMTAMGVANVLYGMRLLQMRDIEVAVLWNVVIHYMQRTVAAMKSRDEKLANFEDLFMQPYELSMALYGLSNYSSDSPEIREVFKLIVPMIPGPGGKLAVIEEGFFGYSNKLEVPNKLMSGYIPLTPTNACCLIYGFKSLSTSQSEVKDLLRAVLPLLQECITKSKKAEFNKHNLFMCIIGIRNLSPSSAEAKELYDVIARYMLNFNDIGYAWSKKGPAAASSYRYLVDTYIAPHYTGDVDILMDSYEYVAANHPHIELLHLLRAFRTVIAAPLKMDLVGAQDHGDDNDSDFTGDERR